MKDISGLNYKNKIDLLSLNKFLVEKNDATLNYFLQVRKYIPPTKENAFKFYLYSLDKDFLYYCKFDSSLKEEFYERYYETFILSRTTNIIPDKFINKEILKELIEYNKYIYNSKNILSIIIHTKFENILDYDLVKLAANTFKYSENYYNLDSFSDYVPEKFLTKEVYLILLKNQSLENYEHIYDELSADMLNDYEILSYIVKYEPWAIFNYRDKNNEEFYLLLKEAVLKHKEILESRDIPLKFKERLKKELNLKEYISKEVKSLLKEDIYGNKAIVYHRSKKEDFYNFIYNKSYYGNGEYNEYGDGLYTTFDLDSQLTDQMKYYGPYIFKIEVNIKNFLILEYNEFIKHPNFKKLGSPDENNFIQSQLEDKGIKFNIEDNNIKTTFSNKTNIYSVYKYSSKLAKYLTDTYSIESFFDGIIFKGERDGNVLLIFKRNLYELINILGLIYNDKYIRYEKLLDKNSKEYNFFKGKLNYNLNKNQLNNKELFKFYKDKLNIKSSYIKKVPYNTYNYYELAKFAILKNPENLEYINKDIKNYYDLCKLAVSKNGMVLEYVPENLKTYELCELAIMNDGRALFDIPKEIENYYSLVKLAYKRYKFIINMFNFPKEYLPDLKKDFPEDFKLQEYISKEVRKLLKEQFLKIKTI